MNLDELKTLNIKDIGGWPMLPKMAVLLALLLAAIFAAYWFDWNAQMEQLEKSREEEAKIREEYLGKKKQAINLDIYRQQLKEIEQSFGALLKQLPNKSEMDALLVEINQAGLGRGLEFELFKPTPEVMSEFYAEVPVTLKVTGGYHDLGNFAGDIAQMPRIVTLNEVKIDVAKDGRLSMDAVAKTYRYLDEAEVAARQKAERDALAAKKGGKK
ncbi:MAG: type 4a pilus biogenesis protein PilO [Sulfuricellaceae bacterium]|nr:type 4a pilus biogenesis protein PilO [Sulfuricellaceae bacterium]